MSTASGSRCLRWLSKRGNNFITDWVNEERILTYTVSTPNEFLKFLHGHPNTCSARSERISLLSEPTQDKFIADQKINCIAGWVNGEKRIEHFSEKNFTGLDQSFHCIQPAPLSSEPGISEILATPIQPSSQLTLCELLTTPSKLFSARSNHLWSPYTTLN